MHFWRGESSTLGGEEGEDAFDDDEEEELDSDSEDESSDLSPPPCSDIFESCRNKVKEIIYYA